MKNQFYSGFDAGDGSEVPPESVPDHEFVHRIGRGSYGEVWLARNRLGTMRAVKIVRRTDFDEDRPYEREFAGIRKFEPISRSHEGFVDLLQVGRSDTEGYFYYVMELADRVDPGAAVVKSDVLVERRAAEDSPPYQPRTLAAEVKARGALPLDDCLRIARTLTSALAELHRQGLVHRDIKPSNIIFVDGVPKLADIGLVAAATEARSFVGTEGFIPPEGPGTPQADLYSLGILLYVISTGKSHRDFPEPPADLASRPDRERWLELQAIFHRTCQADPNQRYQSAEAMLAELDLLERGQSVRRKRVLHQRWSFLKRVALVLLTLAVVATGIVLLQRRLARSEFSGEGPPSRNLDANNLCADGLLILRGDRYADFGKAYTNFQKAIELDPDFARPYVGLIELRLREWQPLKQIDEEELGTLLKKLEQLGPNLAVTHYARAFQSYRVLDFPQAKKSIQKAIELDPKYELARTDYGFMLLTWGWPIEARQQLEKSLLLAPSKVTIYCWLGHAYRAERDYAKAIFWYEKTLKYSTQHPFAFGGLRETYEALGDYEKAIENNEKESLARGGDPISAERCSEALRKAIHDRGARGYYEQQWEWAKNDANEESYWKACLQMRLGNTNTALDWLEKSVQTKLHNGSAEMNLMWLLVHPCWDPVRDDPQFKKLLKESRFLEVMPPRK